MGTSLQPIGKIPLNAYCAITLKPNTLTPKPPKKRSENPHFVLRTIIEIKFRNSPPPAANAFRSDTAYAFSHDSQSSHTSELLSISERDKISIPRVPEIIPRQNCAS